jgi:hypothetical protein
VEESAMTAWFQERQDFRRTPFLRWLVVVMIAMDAAIVAFIFLTIWRRQPDNPVVWVMTAVVMLVMLGLLGLYFVARLDTNVSEEGVTLRLFPFGMRKIAAGEIRDARIVEVRPMEYGGWGVRWVPGGRAYILRGGRGVRIELTSGKFVLIESCRPEELLAAIQDARR